jgi:hypothetical protein
VYFQRAHLSAPSPPWVACLASPPRWLERLKQKIELTGEGLGTGARETTHAGHPSVHPSIHPSTPGCWFLLEMARTAGFWPCHCSCAPAHKEVSPLEERSFFLKTSSRDCWLTCWTCLPWKWQDGTVALKFGFGVDRIFIHRASGIHFAKNATASEVFTQTPG